MKIYWRSHHGESSDRCNMAVPGFPEEGEVSGKARSLNKPENGLLFRCQIGAG